MGQSTRRHLLRNATLALLLAGLDAAGPAVTTALAGARRTYTRTTRDLRLARPQEAGKLEAVLPDPAVTRAARLAVTDLVLVAGALGAGIRPPGDASGPEAGDIDATLAAPNTDAPPPRSFGMRLLAVAGARLHHGGSAVCGGWHEDRSVCRMACDGGRFELVRRLTADGPSFRVAVGGIGPLEDGLLVSSCDGSGPEVRLLPKTGRAEVVLVGD